VARGGSIGRYVVLDVLGEGAMRLVYVAFDSVVAVGSTLAVAALGYRHAMHKQSRQCVGAEGEVAKS
jgi:hypothetical protein